PLCSNIALSKAILEHNGEDAINLAISCVGRKLVLGQKSEEEIEAVTKNFSDNVLQVGYYSYGEISPLNSGACDLHNQTMTLTLIWECEND
ncbi:MAG: FIST C-terminal domain-containing protein, partial [Campylobacteraceae bacterium]|nr:FIST C-terminal domain-containing protein [Campylobacteraceae bacterium]